MTIDYTKLREQLIPTPDGEPNLILRTGEVLAVNADGTADILLSGVTVPDVPRLNGSLIQVGAAVQILSYRGSLLILGLTTGQQSSNSVRGYWQYLEVTSDLPITSSTTLTDIPNLVFLVPPLTKMSVKVRLSVSGPAAGGGKIGLFVGGGTTVAERTVSAAATPSAGSNDTTQMVNAMANVSTVREFGIPANFTRYTEDAVFRNDHATDESTVFYKFAQRVSNGSVSTVHAGLGSTIEIMTLGSNTTTDSDVY